MTNKIVTEQQNNQKTYFDVQYEDLFGPNIWYFIVYFTGL